MHQHLYRIVNTLHENEPDTPTDTTDTATKDTTDTATKPKLFTQTEVNALLADNKRSLRKQVDELNGLVEELKGKGTNHDDLNEKINQLQSALSTKEELAEREKKKLQKEKEEQVTQLTKQLESLNQMYTSETLTRAITDAAVANKAYAPEQIVALLRTSARLEDELGEDDKPTGRRVPKVKITVPGDDGKDKELDLTIPEAVKVMRDTRERYGNLFNADDEGGLGMFGFGRGGREPDALAVAKTKDLQKYREYKKKHGI